MRPAATGAGATPGVVGRDLQVLQVEAGDLLERRRRDDAAPDRAAGSSTVTSITSRGFVAGTIPTNEAMYFSSNSRRCGSGFAAVPVLPATL